MMRWYGIDGLRAEDTAKLAAALAAMELGSGLDGLFWLPVPAALLSPRQVEHGESCGPHVMGLELEETSLRLELLVRARGRLRCDCVQYASPELRDAKIAWLEDLLAAQNITD